MNDIELGELRANVQNTREDVVEMKCDIKAIKDMVETLDNRYYTRREGRVVSIILGIAVTLIGIFGDVKDLLGIK